MKKFMYLNNSNEVVNAIYELGSFVWVSVNDTYISELDLENTCGWGEVMVTFDEYIYNKGYYKAIKSDLAVTLLMNNGDIVEFSKSNNEYLTKEEALEKVKEFSKQGKMAMVNIFYNEYDGREESRSYIDMDMDQVEKVLTDYYEYGWKASKKCIAVRENSLCLYNYSLDDKNRYCHTVIGIENELKEEKQNKIKIIQTNKFRKYMEVHKKQFILPYKNLIKYMQLKGEFKQVKDKFVEMVIDFPFDIGYTQLCEITSGHKIVYAKRKNRDIYSKFTLNGRSRLINKCVVVLKQSFENPDEYYLITMFPGEHIVKEPQDRNIKDKEEIKKVLEFWNNHALTFNPKEINLESIIYDCPFEHKSEY
ncbi:hypothetical protein GOM49_16125 [Clostridium bovifaecis]|uniref:Uncharacterized protein n=1 Tax=Clostridium bovifaecis TaxID=2184719 RepID=A0A6I6F7S8_9CLOT|nr:hypothetical protein GOM49_16125 [Clostridium bovifaecis]